MLQINGKEWNKLVSVDIKNALNDIDESFFYEFKEDQVSKADLIKEISAFSNTYGGYIFIGVSDDKIIKGCNDWNEERILNVIRDSLSPIPDFDVKRFEFEDGSTVLVIRINEGSQPPYITNKGLIYERISSGSCVVKESSRLIQMYQKRADQLRNIENKISISEIKDNINNLYGYIDMGFVIGCRNTDALEERFWNIILEEVRDFFDDVNPVNISRIGESIIVTCSEAFMRSINGDKLAMPAGVNNFIEIMKDGSVRMRFILASDNNSEQNISMASAILLHGKFKEVYSYIFKEELSSNFIYAKYYEKLKIIKQFHPILFYENEVRDADSDTLNNYRKALENHIRQTGNDIVITDDRIPKIGFYYIDRYYFENNGLEFSEKEIIDVLFGSRFVFMGSVPQ